MDLEDTNYMMLIYLHYLINASLEKDGEEDE